MNRRDRLRELDLLRFAAAMAVLLYHFTGFGGSGPWPEPARELFPALGQVTRYGYLGVDLFFMISGFVILMSAWDRGPGEFGISRVARLMPAYWFSVLLGGAVYLVFGLGKGVPGLVVPNLTMLQAGLGLDNVDAVYWTLWIELHFYFLVALLAAKGITYRSCLAFMAAWLLCGVFADEAENRFLQVMLVPTWSPYFIAGMALYLIHRCGPTLLLWGYVAAAWLLATHWAAWRTDVAFKGADEVVAAAAVAGIFVVMILVATGKTAWLRWRGLTVLGALTYPLYLMHSQIALPLLERVYPSLNRWTALALVTAASLAAAYVVHRLVERPAQRWLRRRLHEALIPLRTSTREGTGRTASTSRPADAELVDAAGRSTPLG
ncbi:MAG: acyltransferase [Actinomadura rubrobrunea]|nr:acyltransferase [Actinomadura rubrobrunea]